MAAGAGEPIDVDDVLVTAWSGEYANALTAGPAAGRLRWLVHNTVSFRDRFVLEVGHAWKARS